MRVDGRRRSDIFRLDYILYKKTAALALHLLTAISPMYEYMLITTSIPHLYVYLISKSPSTRVEFSQPPLSLTCSHHTLLLLEEEEEGKKHPTQPHSTPLYPLPLLLQSTYLPIFPIPSHPIPSLFSSASPHLETLLSIHPSIHPSDRQHSDSSGSVSAARAHCPHKSPRSSFLLTVRVRSHIRARGTWGWFG